jgi:hypothetical protein
MRIKFHEIWTVLPLLLGGCVVASQPTPQAQLGCVQTQSATAGQGPTLTCAQPNGTWVAAAAPPTVSAKAQPPPPPPIYVQPPPVIIAPPPAYAYPAPYGYYGGW